MKYGIWYHKYSLEHYRVYINKVECLVFDSCTFKKLSVDVLELQSVQSKDKTTKLI